MGNNLMSTGKICNSDFNVTILIRIIPVTTFPR